MHGRFWQFLSGGTRQRGVGAHGGGGGEVRLCWDLVCLCFSFDFIIYSMAEQFYFLTFFGRAVTELLSVSGKYYTPITGKYIRS